MHILVEHLYQATNIECSKVQIFFRPKIIKVLFLETSEYFLGSVGRQNFFILRIFFTLEKHENHSKYPKNTEKNLKCLKKNLGRPQKSRVGRVSQIPETRHFFFGLSTVISTPNNQRCHKKMFYLITLASVFTPMASVYSFWPYCPLLLFV